MADSEDFRILELPDDRTICPFPACNRVLKLTQLYEHVRRPTCPGSSIVNERQLEHIRIVTNLAESRYRRRLREVRRSGQPPRSRLRRTTRDSQERLLVFEIASGRSGPQSTAHDQAMPMSNQPGGTSHAELQHLDSQLPHLNPAQTGPNGEQSEIPRLFQQSVVGSNPGDDPSESKLRSRQDTRKDAERTEKPGQVQSPTDTVAVHPEISSLSEHSESSDEGWPAMDALEIEVSSSDEEGTSSKPWECEDIDSLVRRYIAPTVLPKKRLRMETAVNDDELDKWFRETHREMVQPPHGLSEDNSDPVLRHSPGKVRARPKITSRWKSSLRQVENEVAITLVRMYGPDIQSVCPDLL